MFLNDQVSSDLMRIFWMEPGKILNGAGEDFDAETTN